MDIKKIKSILKTNSKSKSRHEECDSSLSDSNKLSNDLLIGIKRDEFANNYVKEKESRELLKSSTLNPDVESDILNSIDSKYFATNCDENGEESNSSIAEELILNQLPDELSVKYLLGEQQRLKQQLIVVSKKVSDLILKNQSAYAHELEKVTQLQTSLSDAIKVCTNGRKHLDVSKRDFTCISLGIVASYRRRELLKALLKCLQTIKTLQETDIRLRELLEEDEDYSAAIQLYLECHKVVISLKHYKCMSELNSKLEDTLEMIEEQIDVALSKMCINFQQKAYLKLHNAYNLLGKTQTAMDQLLMHFASAIHNKAFSIVLGYVELFAQNDNSANYHKRQYNELCKQLTSECFTPCLTDLCKALWDIMLNYYRILTFHRHQQLSDEKDSMTDDEIEVSFNKRFVKQKLEHGLGRVWQDVLQKVRTLIANHDLASYNIDEFIKILGIAETMIQIGDEFCSNKSEDLQTLLHKQTINYFQSYHKSCISELKIFLESEIWSPCPVTHNFSLIQLQEFSFLRKRIPSAVNNSPNTSPSKREHLSYYFSHSFLEQTNSTLVTPFDMSPDSNDDDREKFVNDRVLMVSEEDYGCDDEINEKKANGFRESEPIVANTTLNVLRLFGKYMQMMSLLSPIAFDVLLCMFQLFDYYLYAVYKFFAKDMTILSETSLSVEMKQTLKRISDNLIIDQNSEAFAENNSQPNKYLCPTLSSMVDISSVEKLYGLAERIVAVESLVFLGNQMKHLKSCLTNLIASDKQSCVEQYYNKVVSIVVDLRKPVYMWVTVKCIQYEQIVALMAQTKWDTREILSMHNEYVDCIVRELQIFSMRLTHICAKQLPDIGIPEHVCRLLWENVLRLSNRTFIEGFAQSRRCTNEGRALMQLDFQQFLTKVETLTSVRPIPERELVDDYIKAYYLTEPALIEWVKSRNDYNLKQLLALVNCITFDNKKMRTRIMTALDFKL